MKNLEIVEVIKLQLFNEIENETIWYYDDDYNEFRNRLIYCPCSEEICCDFCDKWDDFPEEEVNSISLEIAEWEHRMEKELDEWLEECEMNDHEFYKDSNGEYQLIELS